MTHGTSLAHQSLIGDSIVMRQLREEIRFAACSEIPVLISGETGAGKELVALDLHRRSGRAGAFVAVNVCAPSDSMFEAAMFGHRRGAYTGAFEDRRGFFAEADGGTLFLDEICSLSMDAQAKLLRAIETQRFRPIGGRADVVSSFRLVTATNRSLRDEVDAGRFRADLFYRLIGYEIEVPPLRHRREDVEQLFRHFLDVLDPAGACPRALSEEAFDCIVRHDWPGNVRELRHAAWRAATRSVGAHRIELVHLSSQVDRARAAQAPRRDSLRTDPAARALFDVLVRFHWDTEAVARELGVTRKTVYARMKRLRLPTRREAVPVDLVAVTSPHPGLPIAN